MQEKSEQLLTYLYWCLWSIISKELRLAVFEKSFGQNSVQLWFSAQLSCCSKLASKHSAQLSFYLKVANCEKAKTSAKHRAQLSCCSKLASKHSAQLSFCLKLATFVKKLKIVKNSARNCKFT